jgi:hypothetical protein
VKRNVVDGTEIFRKSIEAIHELRARLEIVERAFRAYVTDDLDQSNRGEKSFPPVLGLCATCGFPVYESDIGNRGRFHYSPQRYMSKPLVCGLPKLDSETDTKIGGSS